VRVLELRKYTSCQVGVQYRYSNSLAASAGAADLTMHIVCFHLVAVD
jgi:hypothetical protein